VTYSDNKIFLIFLRTNYLRLDIFQSCTPHFGWTRRLK